MSLDEAVSATVEWYVRFHQNDDLHRATLSQIDSYSSSSSELMSERAITHGGMRAF